MSCMAVESVNLYGRGFLDTPDKTLQSRMRHVYTRSFRAHVHLDKNTPLFDILMLLVKVLEHGNV